MGLVPLTQTETDSSGCGRHIHPVFSSTHQQHGCVPSTSGYKPSILPAQSNFPYAEQLWRFRLENEAELKKQSPTSITPGLSSSSFNCTWTFEILSVVIWLKVKLEILPSSSWTLIFKGKVGGCSAHGLELQRELQRFSSLNQTWRTFCQIIHEN